MNHVTSFSDCPATDSMCPLSFCWPAVGAVVDLGPGTWAQNLDRKPARVVESVWPKIAPAPCSRSAVGSDCQQLQSGTRSALTASTRPAARTRKPALPSHTDQGFAYLLANSQPSSHLLLRISHRHGFLSPSPVRRKPYSWRCSPGLQHILLQGAVGQRHCRLLAVPGPKSGVIRPWGSLVSYECVQPVARLQQETWYLQYLPSKVRSMPANGCSGPDNGLVTAGMRPTNGIWDLRGATGQADCAEQLDWPKVCGGQNAPRGRWELRARCECGIGIVMPGSAALVLRGRVAALLPAVRRRGRSG